MVSKTIGTWGSIWSCVDLDSVPIECQDCRWRTRLLSFEMIDAAVVITHCQISRFISLPLTLSLSEYNFPNDSCLPIVFIAKKIGDVVDCLGSPADSAINSQVTPHIITCNATRYRAPTATTLWWNANSPSIKFTSYRPTEATTV